MKDQPVQMLVTMTRDELEQTVDRAVDRRLSELVAGPRFMTIVQLCEMLDVSKPTATALVREGLPAVRVGRELRFERTAVAEWLRENRSEPAKPPPKKNVRGHLRSV